VFLIHEVELLCELHVSVYDHSLSYGNVQLSSGRVLCSFSILASSSNCLSGSSTQWNRSSETFVSVSTLVALSARGALSWHLRMAEHCGGKGACELSQNS